MASGPWPPTGLSGPQMSTPRRRGGRRGGPRKDGRSMEHPGASCARRAGDSPPRSPPARICACEYSRRTAEDPPCGQRTSLRPVAKWTSRARRPQARWRPELLSLTVVLTSLSRNLACESRCPPRARGGRRRSLAGVKRRSQPNRNSHCACIVPDEQAGNRVNRRQPHMKQSSFSDVTVASVLDSFPTSASLRRPAFRSTLSNCESP